MKKDRILKLVFIGIALWLITCCLASWINKAQGQTTYMKIETADSIIMKAASDNGQMLIDGIAPSKKVINFFVQSIPARQNTKFSFTQNNKKTWLFIIYNGGYTLTVNPDEGPVLLVSTRIADIRKHIKQLLIE